MDAERSRRPGAWRRDGSVTERLHPWANLRGREACGHANMTTSTITATPVVTTGSRPATRGGSFIGGLLAVAIWAPPAVAAATVGVYLSVPSSVALKEYAPAVGLAIGLALWAVAGIVTRGRATPAGGNESSYSELAERLLSAQTAIASVGSPQDDVAAMAKQQAESGRVALERLLGLSSDPQPLDGMRWITAHGYVDAWQRLHRIEEWLLLFQPDAIVVSDAFEDVQRLRGSGMSGADDLTATLRQAVHVLNPAADPFFIPAGTTPPAAAGADKMLARTLLGKVRQAINDFRDGRWDGIIRARNHLVRGAVFTGLTAYALLVVAILRGATDIAVASASTYFLVGAVVGLFARLRADADATSAVEDYGLATVRLITTPLVSGLAAVGGVVLTVLLASPAVSGVVLPHAAGATSTPAETASLVGMFDVVAYPLGIIVAAAFGLAPGLLISQLQKQADRYQQELQRSEPGDGARGGTPS